MVPSSHVQLPVMPAPGELAPSSGLRKDMHSHAHMQTITDICTYNSKLLRLLGKKGFYYFKCNVKHVGSYFLVTYLHIGLSFFKLTLVVNVENNGLAVYQNVVQISIFQKNIFFQQTAQTTRV